MTQTRWTDQDRNTLEQIMTRPGMFSKYESYQKAAEVLGRSLESCRQQWAKIRGSAGVTDEHVHIEAGEGETLITRTFSADDMRRITSLDELIGFFDIDLDRWTIRNFRVNSWEQKPGIALYQVRCVLEPKSPLQDPAVIEQLWQDFKEDAQRHTPVYESPLWHPPAQQIFALEPCMLMLAIVDPHIGMLAWGRECGEPYDLEIAIKNYTRAVDQLLEFARGYPIEAIRFLVGHDLFHADTLIEGRAPSTTRGTLQDLDTRLPKLFTAVRRAVVGAIDKARLVAPVKVLCVPGNHDEQTVYKFGEVLHAWYRNDPEVEIDYGASRRRYDLYGKTVFLHTHGEEFARKRDNLVSVFATECPKEMWAAADYREVLLGHFHKSGQRVFTGDPLEIEWEGRATRVRLLPALTAIDSWHHGQGYQHTRAATVLVYRRSGGLAGHHEIVL